MERTTARFSTPCFLKSQRFTGGRVRSHQGQQPILQRRNLSQPSLLGEWVRGPRCPGLGPLVPAALTSGSHDAGMPVGATWSDSPSHQTL